MTTAASAVPGRAALLLRATRPRYLPTSVVPAAAGALVALGTGDARWWLLPAALLALLLVHAGTNVVNDVEDFARGVDTEEKMDNSRVFTTGLMSVAQGRALGMGLFAGGAVVGVAIAAVQGPGVLLYGLLGTLGGYLYTGGPRPYKHVGLGDPLIILLMGPLMTQGAYTAVTGDVFDAPAFWVGLIPGLLISATVAGNNLSDILGDARAGVRTLAVRIGFGRARALYLASLALAYATPVVLVATGLFGPALLLVLATAPIAWRRAAQARAAARSGDPVILTLAPGTAQLHLLACIALIVAVVLDRGL